MKRFWVTFENKERHLIEAPSLEALLATQSSTPHSVTHASLGDFHLRQMLEPSISAREILYLLEYLSSMLEAGWVLFEALQALSQEPLRPKTARMVASMTRQLSQGHTLSSAMEPYVDAFGETVIDLVRVGEKNGALAQTLAKAHRHLQFHAMLRTKIRQALIYPLIMLAIVGVSVGVWMGLVLPQLVEAFGQMRIELPPLTLWLVDAWAWLVASIGYLAFGVVVAVSASVMSYRKNRWLKAFVWRMLLHLPWVGAMIRAWFTAQFAHAIELSMLSGMTLFAALQERQKSAHNTLYHEALGTLHSALSQGSSLSHAMQSTLLFTPYGASMAAMGERQGDLAGSMGRLSRYYELRFESVATTFSKLLEPLLIVGVGLFYAVMLLAMLGPIYDMMGQVR
ncbi:MAG: hypothetical protein KU37_05025 [Sulfuricurvum sp. PC08-66]|nr:MAG: hypothetical protein KU37_05025 [Sulfuricurvum sp. PC08-66]